ncbi:hypothetical protein SMZ59_003223 [Salmonella enterica]|nr:hypothetical protein [Salmonella enterica]
MEFFNLIKLNNEMLYQTIFIILSIVGLISYYIGYVLAIKHKDEKTFTKAGYFCFVGGFTSLFWIIMPFFPQPRIGFWTDNNITTPAIFMHTYGLILFIWFLNFTVRATKSNLTATSKYFFSPTHLITDGQYRVLRHPMLMGDFFAHLGLSLMLGAIYTTLLLPLYYIINETFIEIQERKVLRVKFKEEYILYAKNTPRSWNLKFFILFILSVLFFLWAMMANNVNL